MRRDPRDDHLGVLLTAYADGSLPEEGCAFIERQLEEHPELRDRLGEIRAAQEVLRTSLPAAPAGLGDDRLAAVMAAARQPARRVFRRTWILVASAACVLLAVAGTVSVAGTVRYASVEQLEGDTAFRRTRHSTGEGGGDDVTVVAGEGRRAWSFQDSAGSAFAPPPVAAEPAPAPAAKPLAERGLVGGLVPNEPVASGSVTLGQAPAMSGTVAAKDIKKQDVQRSDLDKATTSPVTSPAAPPADRLDGLAASAKGKNGKEAQVEDSRAGGRKSDPRWALDANKPAARPARESNRLQAAQQQLAKAEEQSAYQSAAATPVAGTYTFSDRLPTTPPGWTAEELRRDVPEVVVQDLAQAQQEYLQGPTTLAFVPQARGELIDLLAPLNRLQQARMQRQSSRLPVAEALLDVLPSNLQGDGEVAVPFRLLVDPNQPVRMTNHQRFDEPGQAVLNLVTANRLQLVPLPGGFEVQAARPLDPTATFGWSRDDLRRVFGSVPMQNVAEDAQQTFAIDASTSSFDSALAALDAGRQPDPAQIEPQHLYNAVPMDYPAASGNDAFQLFAEAGPSPFASGALATRTALVAIGVVSRPAASDERIPLDLVVALDASGSMGRPGGLARARAGLDALMPQLDARDRVAVVAFGDVARVVQPALAGNHQAQLASALDQVRPAGSTNLADGLSLACQVASELATPGRSCRVLLITDGAALAGDSAQAAEAAVARWRGRGVSLLIVGCADETYDGTALERLAQRGDGEHQVATSDEAARALFTGRLLPSRLAILARDAKAQVTWNPERVTYARLIGFEHRRLAAEQFRDDSVDAGELAQDAHATALFEVVLSDHGSGPLGTAAVRYHDTRLNRVVELTRPLPGGLVTATASPRLRLLACAAELGETMQCGWWRNVRGLADGRIAAELARLDLPFARILERMERRFRDLERQDATP